MQYAQKQKTYISQKILIASVEISTWSNSNIHYKPMLSIIGIDKQCK